MKDTISEEEYRTLVQRVEKAKTRASQAQGALNSLWERAKEEFGCSDMKEAKKMLAKLEREKETASKEFTEAVDAYKKKWKKE